MGEAAKGAKKVDRLDSAIENHAAQIEKKQGQVSDLEAEITSNKDSIEEETVEMTNRTRMDTAALADLATVISQCKRAIQQLKDSDVSGTALLSLAKTVLRAALRVKDAPRGVEELAFLVEPGKPHAFNFHSQVVVELLQKLQKQFENERVEKDHEAMRARSQSQTKIQQTLNLVVSQTNQKNEYQSEIDKHTTQKQVKEEDRTQAAKDLSADTDFARHLVGHDRIAQLAKDEGEENLSAYLEPGMPAVAGIEQGMPAVAGIVQGAPGTAVPGIASIGECGQKRENYAQRVKTREGEIVALSQAIEIMQGGGGENYSANKHLTLVHQHTFAQETPDDDSDDDDDDQPVFLQFTRRRNRQLLRFLSREAKVLKSSTLSALLLKVKMGDHFKDIRKLINDLIAQLETQLQGELEQKEWCDKQLKQTHAGRKEAQKGVETATSNIDSETAKKSVLEKEIDELRKQIVADREAREKQSSLREEEKAENDQIVSDAKEGVAAVREAIKILKSFYDANATNFVQQPDRVSEHEDYRAQGEDASGNTMADIRPESDAFGSASKGSQAEGQGIIGILEVIQSDYDGTVQTVSANEKDSAKEYEIADQDLADQIAADEETVKAKSDARDEAQEAVTDNQGDLGDSKAQVDSRQEELQQLKPLCSSVEAEEQKEERRKRRKQEITALREALQILRDASFLAS